MIDFVLFYSRKSKQEMIDYADAGYLSDLHKIRSQTGCVTCGGTSILTFTKANTYCHFF